MLLLHLILIVALTGCTQLNRVEEVGIQSIPDDLLIIWWQNCLSLSTHLEFYKTSKRYYSLLRPKLRVDLVKWIDDKPLLRIFNIYHSWDGATGRSKRDIKKFLLLSKQVSVYEEFLFRKKKFEYAPKALGLKKKQNWFGDSPRSKSRLLLEHGLDPELVAIFMTKLPHILLPRDSFDCYWVVHKYGVLNRAKALRRQMYQHFWPDGPGVPMFSKSNPYISLLSPANLRTVLDDNWSCERVMSEQSLKFAVAQLNDNERLEIVFDHYPIQSIKYNFEILEILYKRDFPIQKIMTKMHSICLDKNLEIPDFFQIMLSNYYVGHEEFVERLVLSLESAILEERRRKKAKKTLDMPRFSGPN